MNGARKTHFDRRYFHFDFARERIYHEQEMNELLDILAALGYNGLCVYVEGALDFEAFPGSIRPGVLTRDNVRWLVEACCKRGMVCIPMTNLVGHMEHFMVQERFAHLAKGELYQLDFARSEAEAFALTIVDDFIDMFATDVLHIGGDEVELEEAEQGAYARFLAALCHKLLDRGVRPGIWSDMIWMNPQLIDFFPKEVEVYDWNYYGHRSASLSMWKSKGFERIYACPCENSWEGFINAQRISGHLKSQLEPDVELDEIEAFLQDAVDTEIRNGVITTWSHEYGNPFWAQLVPIARAGLFMSGDWVPGAPIDEQVELLLFGRHTPYTAVTRTLQTLVQKPLQDLRSVLDPGTARKALYHRGKLFDLLDAAPDIGPGLITSFERALPAITEQLTAWTPASYREELCHMALELSVANIRAAIELLRVGSQASAHYKQAAELQYVNREESAACLRQAIRTFAPLLAAYDALAEVLDAVSEASGHSRSDAVRLQHRKQDIVHMIRGIERCISFVNGKADQGQLPLPAWKKYIRYCVMLQPIRGYPVLEDESAR
ncbi:family 20 glycosylhydrolase [Paenibacillus sabuli]